MLRPWSGSRNSVVVNLESAVRGERSECPWCALDDGWITSEAVRNVSCAVGKLRCRLEEEA